MTTLAVLAQKSPWILLGLFCVLLVIVAMLFFGIKRIVYPNDGKTTVFGDELAQWPYEPVALMTDAEVRFFRLLQEAIGYDYLIFSQVQLSRIIDADDDDNAGKWLNRINRMSVDYLLVDNDAQTPLIVLELDDWSHESDARQQADAKKDKALNCAGIPVMRFHGEQMPTAEVLSAEVAKVMAEVYGERE